MGSSRPRFTLRYFSVNAFLKQLRTFYGSVWLYQHTLYIWIKFTHTLTSCRLLMRLLELWDPCLVNLLRNGLVLQGLWRPIIISASSQISPGQCKGLLMVDIPGLKAMFLEQSFGEIEGHVPWAVFSRKDVYCHGTYSRIKGHFGWAEWQNGCVWTLGF